MNNKYELIDSAMNVEFYPSLPETKIELHDYKKFNLSSLTAVAPAVAALPQQFRAIKSTITIPGGNGKEGIYKVSFEKGVNGVLHQRKDGSGYIGSIAKEGGGLAQATLEGGDISFANIQTIPFDPTTVAIAVALMTINAKLDAIKEVTADIIDFLEEDKKSHAKANLQTLTRALNDYKYNSTNAAFLTSQTTLASSIQRDALQDIDFYKKKIAKLLNNKSFINIASSQFEETFNKVNGQFECLKLNLYIYAFSTFVQCLLLDNHEEQYLMNKITEIRDLLSEYRVFYTDCYNELDKYTKASLGNQLIEGAGGTIKTIGRATKSIPILNKTKIDKTIVGLGKGTQSYARETNKGMMKQFLKFKDPGLQPFVHNIETVNLAYNKPLELLYDGQNYYIPKK